FFSRKNQSARSQDARGRPPPRTNPWGRPPPILVKAARIESLGLTSALQQRNAINTNRTYNSKTEVHMNPISAVIFIIFIGGAVLARLANMPISVSVVLALIGIFLGYSVKMAQQWERAVILRLGKLHAVKGPGLFILVPILDAVATWIDQCI